MGCRRKIPSDLAHLLRMALNAAGWLRCRRCVASFNAVLACPLLVPPEVEFVAPRDLPGEPHGRVLPGAVVEGLMGIVRVIRPLCEIAGIPISPQRYILAVALVACSPVKPEPVLHNRTPKRPIDVPEFLQLVRNAQSGVTQGRGVIAPRQPGAGSVGEDGAVEFVAAYLRKNIHDRAAGCRFAHAAGDREVDFLSIANIRHIKRNAQTLKAHAQALDVNLAFIPASAVRLKDAEDWALDTAYVVTLNVERRDQRRQAVILSPRRNGIDHVAQ